MTSPRASDRSHMRCQNRGFEVTLALSSALSHDRDRGELTDVRLKTATHTARSLCQGMVVEGDDTSELPCSIFSFARGE